MNGEIGSWSETATDDVLQAAIKFREQLRPRV
jgi:hypothetical protein